VTSIIECGRNAQRIADADDSGIIIDARDYYYSFYKAAEQARRYILMSGWQFDTGVKLLRGEDAPPGAEVHFLKFLVGYAARTRSSTSTSSLELPSGLARRA
jgi:hypothetical protein